MAPFSTTARAKAVRQQREQQKADAPVAMAEYRAAQEAVRHRTRELRELRLARQAELAKDASGEETSAKDIRSAPQAYEPDSLNFDDC